LQKCEQEERVMGNEISKAKWKYPPSKSKHKTQAILGVTNRPFSLYSNPLLRDVEKTYPESSNWFFKRAIS
jgi:hypothetical protein